MTSYEGAVCGIQVSDGGVPKQRVASVAVQEDGLVGDRQRYLKFHGGPTRAVCLLGLDVIERLAAEGHPIVPGATGENLTLAGIDWSLVGVGSRFVFAGGVELETLSFAAPCANIRAAFADGDEKRMGADAHPENARHYARVLTSGVIAVGETVRVSGPAEGDAPA